jgi:hypothetical protein
MQRSLAKELRDGANARRDRGQRDTVSRFRSTDASGEDLAASERSAEVLTPSHEITSINSPRTERPGESLVDWLDEPLHEEHDDKPSRSVVGMDGVASPGEAVNRYSAVAAAPS